MASKLLDSKKLKALQPAAALWKRYAPEKAPLRFQARNTTAARRWQKRTRKALAATIGFQESVTAPLAPKRLERVDKGDYVREKWLLQTAPHTLMPTYLLLPKNAPRPAPAVLAFHGHGYGVKDLVGLWEDGGERDAPDGYHKDFGVELCRRGFAIAAPEISCFGERQTDFSHLLEDSPEPTSTCQHTAMLAFHLGGSVAGLRVRDGRRLVDFLETRPEFDTARLGAMGISGGGMHTFFSTALDTRIRACVVSGYFCTFKDSILAMHHCPCNFAPGLHQFGEMHDLAGLIAPRPMLIESGSHDFIFPRAAVRRAARKARAVYRAFNATQSFAADYFEGRHQIGGRRAYDFLKRQLG